MKNYTIITLLCAGIFFSCNSEKKANDNLKILSPKELLKNKLQATIEKGIMFGQHDATLYGINWEFEDGRSDVKAVCGDYPAVISFDLGHIELGDSLSLDKVPFRKMREEIINQYKRGGLVSLSWHARNPLTGGDAWDVSDKTTVASILPGGTNAEKFNQWLGIVNNFILSLKTEDGAPVPVLFRPWHEHTGSWFWWGQNLCTADQYKALWTLTTNYLKNNGADEQILYAYSSGTEPKSTTEYLERYPGKDVIDLLGFDSYQREDKALYIREMSNCLAIIDSVAKDQNKIIAITETGFETVPDSTWWTETLLPLAQSYPLSYVLVWRNAREIPNHYFGPYPGQISSANFIEFYKKPNTLFASDINLYNNN